MGNSSRKDWTARIGGIDEPAVGGRARILLVWLGWCVSRILGAGVGGRVGCGGGRRALLVGVGWLDVWLVAGSQF